MSVAHLQFIGALMGTFMASAILSPEVRHALGELGRNINFQAIVEAAQVEARNLTRRIEQEGRNESAPISE